MIRRLTKTTRSFRSIAALGTVVLILGLGFCPFLLHAHSLNGHGPSRTCCSGLSMGPIAIAPVLPLLASGSLDVVWTSAAHAVDRIPLDHPPEFILAAY